jgi:hypothetical protein
MSAPHSFEIALSFPSKHRRVVKSIAGILSSTLGTDKVFYDDDHFAKIAGSDGADRLRDVFENSKLVVPFFSSHYQASKWCGFEWSVIKEMLFANRQTKAVAVRLDGTEVPGWPKTAIDIVKGQHGANNASDIASKILQVYREKFGEKSNANERPKLDRSKVDEPIPDHPLLATGGSKWLNRLVIVADICDSSSFSGQGLQLGIETLWHSAESLGVYTPKGSDIGNSLLDGMILSLERSDADAQEQLVALCNRWMSEWTTSVGSKGLSGGKVRLAIHQGDICHISRNGGTFIVGPAANECSRLVRYAGQDQIILSEAFVASWIQRSGNKVSNRLNAPIEVHIKQGSLSRFRFLKRDEKSVQPSDQLAKIDLADKAIETALVRMVSEYLDLVSSTGDSKLSAKKIGARVSLFAPRMTDQVLEPTNYRLVWSSSKNRFQRSSEKGKTEYPFQSTRGPVGPLARAFLERKVFAVNDLPPFGSSPKRYKSILSQNWGVNDDLVDHFGVKARSFLAIPVFLDSNGETADAVVCLDTIHPLDHLDGNALEEIGEYLRYQVGLSLAALWLLRS